MVPRIIGSAGGAAGGSLIAESFDPTEEPKTKGQRAGEAAITGAVAEAATPLVQRLTAPFANQLLPGAAVAGQRLAARGQVLTPASAIESKFIDLLQGIGEASIISSKITQRKLGAQEAAKLDIGDFVAQFGEPGSREALGMVLQDAVRGGEELFQQTSRRLYSKVDEAIAASGRPLMVDIRAVKDAARRELARQPEKPKSRLTAEDKRALREQGRSVTELPAEERFLPTQQGGTIASGPAKTLATNTTLFPDRIPFERAQLLRSEWLKARRVVGELDPERAPALAGSLAKRMDDAITASGQQIQGREAVKAFREANRFFRSGDATVRFGRRDFEDTVIGKVVDAMNPSDTVSILINEGSPETIRRVFNIVANKPEAGKQLKAAFVNKLFGQSQRYLQSSGITTLFRAEGGARTKQGALAVQFQQFGSLMSGGSILGGFMTGSGPAVGMGLAGVGTFLIVPAMLNRAMANRTIARWLNRAAQGRTEKEVLEAGTKALSLMKQEGISALFVTPKQMQETLRSLDTIGGPPELVQDPAITNVETIQQRMMQDPIIRRELREIEAGKRPTFSRETALKLEQFEKDAQKASGDELISIFPELPALPPRQP